MHIGKIAIEKKYFISHKLHVDFYPLIRAGLPALCALNPDGSLKWSRDLGQPAYSPAIGQNGNLYVLDPKLKVSAFSANGAQLYTFNDYDFPNFYKRDMGQRTPAIAADGTVYIGGMGYGAGYTGMFNAVLTASQGYAAVLPWPRFRHDNKNSGRFS